MSEDKNNQAFNRESLNKEDELHGDKVEERFGNENVNQADDRFLDMSQDEVKGKNQIEEKLFKAIDDIKKNGATLEKQRNVTEFHKEWLTYSWPNYTEEKHLEMINMYEADTRYREYFGEEGSEVLIVAVKHILT